MKEKLINRVGRIISGSFNTVVSALENAVPETVMKEAIREVDDATADVRAELGAVIAKKHLANKRLMEENKKHEDLTANIELAVSEQRDDLAESAIAQQLDIEAQIPVLESAISECSAQENELEGYIAALSAKKRQMKAELSMYKASVKEKEAASTQRSDNGNKSHGSLESRLSMADAAFERVMETATGIHAGKNVANLKESSNIAELEEMARKKRIQERLMAIKGNATND